MTLEVEQFKRKRYIQRYHKTLEEGVKKKPPPLICGNSKTGKGGGSSNTRGRDIQDTTSRHQTIN
jgi:hypothetical protein